MTIDNNKRPLDEDEPAQVAGPVKKPKTDDEGEEGEVEATNVAELGEGWEESTEETDDEDDESTEVTDEDDESTEVTDDEDDEGYENHEDDYEESIAESKNDDDSDSEVDEYDTTDDVDDLDLAPQTTDPWMQWASALEACNKARWAKAWAYQLKETAVSHNNTTTVTITAELRTWREPRDIMHTAVAHFHHCCAAYDHYKAIEKAEEQAYLKSIGISNGVHSTPWTWVHVAPTNVSDFDFDASKYPGSSDEFKTLLRRLSASIKGKVATGA
ncbi:uncharacterized protein LOC62_02G002902 [Vanrija pseudolonga]|uniref:Uncharacterized protein n=1 Tax=Vanrija pseudolonga TaxID=143232 RepID=A0AAF1BPG7_9TREE|nr:hypothetical protein LOC62_02G002902 [Vanrija pseudolonga]